MDHSPFFVFSFEHYRKLWSQGHSITNPFEDGQISPVHLQAESSYYHGNVKGNETPNNL